MAHLGVINLPELLERILYFLAVDKSLYPALFVSRLWYRCGAPILWKHIKLKGNDSYSYHFLDDNKYRAKDRSRLERFIKLVGGKQKPIYSSNLTHLKIAHYHSLSDKKIKSIIGSYSNIIYLNFKSSTDFSDNGLNLIAGAYPNLRYSILICGMLR